MEKKNIANDPRYECRGLIYTKAGLFTLFSWLLWGDFCFSLMETIWPNILPLILQSEGAPNVVLALVITTIPSAMNFVMNPIISTASDRFRGKRGRRIPFLLIATPFVTLFLILLGFSRELTSALIPLISGVFPGLTKATVSIGMICILVICFRFFELFINTVFWYLFNDVVPSAFMGRFLGMFRVVGSLAGAFFNFFLLRYAESHSSMIFLGVALLYGSAFMLMCLNVKEGPYPPPEKIENRSFLPIGYIKTFFRECFEHRIYRLVFGFSAVSQIGNAVGTFSLFMAFSIGLTLNDIGRISGIAGLVVMVLMYPVGVLVDRYHPIRIMLVAQLGICITVTFQLIFLFYDFPKSTAFWIYAGLTGLTIPIGVANLAAALPMVMRIFPQERFGQFCAANAMCGALGTMAGGLLAGVFLDGMKAITGGGDFYYRFVPLWSVVFSCAGTILTVLLLREWKRLGGDESYRSPGSKAPAVVDEMPGIRESGELRPV